jgi:hypothetical protein
MIPSEMYQSFPFIAQGKGRSHTREGGKKKRRKRKMKRREGSPRAVWLPFPYWWALTVL